MADSYLRITRTADGSRLVDSSAAGTLGGTATATLGWAGIISVAAAGVAAATIGWSGEIAAAPTGTATGTLGWSGVVSTEQIGTATATLGWSGIIGVAPGGAASATLGWAGTITAGGIISGTATGTLGWVGLVEIAHGGSARAALGWSGVLDATLPNTSPGTATATLGWAPILAVAVPASGSAVATLGWSGSIASDLTTIIAALDACSRLPWVEIDIRGRTHAYPFIRSRHPMIPSTQQGRLAGLGRLRRPSGVSGGEAANVDCVLDNADGQLTTLLADAQGADFRIVTPTATGTDILIRASVISVSGGQTIRILAVGGDLSARVPLRQAVTIGQYDQAGVIPIVFGSGVSLTPLRYSADGRYWLVSDRSILGVTAVTIDGAPIGPEQYKTIYDTVDGEPVTLVFVARAPQATISVVADGVPDPATGRLLNNPALVVWYLLSEIAGYAIERAEVDLFRIETIDYRVRGLVDGSAGTLRAQIDEIVQSVGGVWSLGMPGLARLWPIDTTYARHAGTLDLCAAPDPTVEQQSIANSLAVEYDYDWAIGDYRRGLVVESAGSVSEHGLVAAEAPLSLRWLGDGAPAEEIAIRRLAHDATPRSIITADVQGIDYQPGDAWTIDHPLVPATGRHPAIEAGLDIAANSTEIQLSGLSGELPAVQILTRSQRLVGAAQITSVRQDTDRIVITATDTAGVPLPGALVVLAGRSVRADGNGEAVFRDILPGTYSVRITSPGGDTVVSSITVSG